MGDVPTAPPILPLAAAGTAATPIPASLPAFLLDLPAALANLTTQQTVQGVLVQVQTTQYQLQTHLGDVLFNLPALRTQPQLQQNLLPFLKGEQPAQLLLSPLPQGMRANLILQPQSQTLSSLAERSPPLFPSLQPGQTVNLLFVPMRGDMLAQPFAWAQQIGQQARNLISQWIQGKTIEPTIMPPSLMLPSPATPQLGEPKFVNTPTGQRPIGQTTVPLTLQLANIVPPRTPMPSIPREAIAATVIGSSSQGMPIIKTDQAQPQNFLLQTSSALPTGTRIVLLPAPESAPMLRDPLPSLPALKEALEALGALAPQLQQNVVQNRIPQLNQSLGGALLFLFSAIRQNEPATTWLGQTTRDTLEKAGKSRLLQALNEDLRNQGQQTHDAVVGDWRAYHLPLLWPPDIPALRLYVHHRDARKHENDGSTQPRQTRFVIDVTFSRLGAMQFDGFVQQHQFDLILRTETGLQAALRHELRQAFTDALGAINFAGQLMFQTGRGQWLNIAPPQGNSVKT